MAVLFACVRLLDSPVSDSLLSDRTYLSCLAGAIARYEHPEDVIAELVYFVSLLVHLRCDRSLSKR